MFKNLLSASILSIGLMSVALPSTSHAQSVNNVNCAALTNSPFMCVKNMSSYPVVAMQASSSNGFNTNAWIRIPGGAIHNSATAIVKFNAWSGGCNQYVTILTSDNRTHTYPQVNVCQATSFNVNGW